MVQMLPVFVYNRSTLCVLEMGVCKGCSITVSVPVSVVAVGI